jgi:hypothetical protein
VPNKHLKLIWSASDEPRRETVVSEGEPVGITGPSLLCIHSALYGDGTQRYKDVTRRCAELVDDGMLVIVVEDALFGEADAAEKQHGQGVKADDYVDAAGLVIHSARYGILGSKPPFSSHSVDVTERVRSLVSNGTLDIIVNNSTLTPGQNPFRGKKKVLLLTYAYDGGEQVTIERQEKEWLIIGQAQRDDAWHRQERDWLQDLKVEETEQQLAAFTQQAADTVVHASDPVILDAPRVALMSVPALNDYLIRKFSISPQRLRAPMPIELRDFHRNDLAQLFAELGFKRGAEIGVAEGNYSEVLLKANPECELLLVDPWHAYSENPQNKSKEKHEFAYNETWRKVKQYPNVRLCKQYSMDAVRDVQDESLDFYYCDGNHLFDYAISDLIWWSNKVRSGGICSGDDLYELDQKRWHGGGVVEAVQAYVRAHRIPVWFTFSGHKSYDYFWVRP